MADPTERHTLSLAWKNEVEDPGGHSLSGGAVSVSCRKWVVSLWWKVLDVIVCLLQSLLYYVDFQWSVKFSWRMGVTGW